MATVVPIMSSRHDDGKGAWSMYTRDWIVGADFESVCRYCFCLSDDIYSWHTIQIVSIGFSVFLLVFACLSGLLSSTSPEYIYFNSGLSLSRQYEEVCMANDRGCCRYVNHPWVGVFAFCVLSSADLLIWTALSRDVSVFDSVCMSLVCFRHVINLVIDNWAQWFVVAPGAINLVQGPANYEALIRMGIPPHQVRRRPNKCVSGGAAW